MVQPVGRIIALDIERADPRIGIIALGDAADLRGRVVSDLGARGADLADHVIAGAPRQIDPNPGRAADQIISVRAAGAIAISNRAAIARDIVIAIACQYTDAGGRANSI